LFINTKVKKTVLNSIILLLILFAGLRYNTGFDYINYKDIYYDFLENKEYWSIEPFFIGLFFLTDFLHLGFTGLIFIVALVSILIKSIFLSKYSHYPLISILLYFSRIFLISDFGQLRQGLAFGIILWSSLFIVKKDFTSFLFLIFLTSTIHLSSIVFLPVFFLANREYKIYSYYILLVLFSPMLFIDIKEIFTSILGLPPFILNKLLFYLEAEADQTIGLNLSSIFRFILIVLSLRFKDIFFKTDYENVVFKIYFFGMIYFLIFQSFPQLGGRGSFYFQQFEFLLIPLIFHKIRNYYLKILSFFLLFIYTFWGVLSTINSQKNIFVPYQTIFSFF
jgi:hypothetical protein